MAAGYMGKLLFVNLDTHEIKEEKPDKSNEIQAITGATVSSNAVTSILNEKIEKIRKNSSKLK